MSESKNNDNSPGTDQKIDASDSNIAVPSDVSSIGEDVKYAKHATSSERQMKFEKAQRCLENAALVSKRIKEHRKATAELLGRPFEEDVRDTASELASTMSEKTGYSVATDTSTTLSVQDALNIPGISESLANTLKQKELLMERIKQYKEISKRPMNKGAQATRRDSITDTLDNKKGIDSTNVTKLINTIKEKENNLSVMQVKIKAMETTILDLQEKINEKDQIIEAKNRATTLISESLSKKEKETMDLLEDTKQQMKKMQTNFVSMETDWKEEKQKLILEIEEKNERLKSLEEANLILENSRFEISVAHSKLLEEVETKSKEILVLQEKIKELSNMTLPQVKEEVKDLEEEKGSLEVSNMNELSKKIELLEQINFEIRQTNKDLENQLASINVEAKINISPSKKNSPVSVRKGSRSTTSKMKSPWSHLSSESLEDKKGKSDKSKPDMLLQSLNKEILDKEFIISQKNNLILDLQSENDKNVSTISKLELLLKTQKEAVKMSEIGVSTDIQESIHKEVATGDVSTESVTDLEHKLKLAQEQIAVLNEEIDMANKNMIKVKSNSKLKLKQMQKTIENFSKVSDTHGEIVRLNEDIHQLSQKVAELEEEKGNLQLHLVDYDSGRLTETEIYKKMIEMENLAETRLKSISLLEAQKFDLVQELHSSQQKNLELEDKIADISQLQNEQVCSEMKSVQLEEQIDELQASKKELELLLDNLKLDNEQLSHSIKTLQNEKEEFIQKLESYIQENIELTDKLEKLSAEKVSSAESIEIVESLTTQEKLELEEYNQGLENENKVDKNPESYKVSCSKEHQTTIPKEKLMEETIELKNKIELFTSERQEVMEKMSKLSLENTSLTAHISELKDICNNLRNEIDILSEEKQKLLSFNIELNHQIEELKQERSEILKETAEIAKPLSVEDTVDSAAVETLSHDDKSVGDKSLSKTKSIKQLTKEILKLKNTIKEKEDDIADLQMKILSLEEQQEKQKEVSQSQVSFEKIVKKLTDENNHLKKDIENITKDNKVEQYIHLMQAHELLQLETKQMHQEYTTAVNVRDSRIHELENLLLEYEKQVVNYNNSLQQKDKEISEYINQVTKLNDVSQKLKSTIDVLEEENTNVQNVELIKSLNKQINLYQKSLTDYEEKLRTLEGEKVQLTSIKSKLEHEISCLELDMKKLQESLAEKQGLIKDLQTQQQKQTEELSNVTLQSKERDEEIHEIKLQLRKESIDNEKLHNIVVQKSNDVAELRKLYDEAKERLSSISSDNNIQNEQYLTLEIKNKELMEKLKKFAANIKKKSALYIELEQQHQAVQKQLEIKNEQYEQLLIQVETIPSLQEKLKHAEEEFNRLQSQKIMLEQKSQEILQLKSEIDTLQKRSAKDAEVITELNEKLNLLNTDLHYAREENNNLNIQIESLNNKIVEHEIEQKNSSNLLTKISCLETDIIQKQNRIEELSSQVEIQNEKLSQIQFGYNAKVQENDMYIESLQSEIDKYKNRIGRLEESISVMECRRHTLERKADNLDTQLQDKQKAYSEYTNQEDELVTRLAVLIDNDRVIEKQLHEIECENKELRFKITQFNEERQHLQNSYAELQNKCSILEDNAKHIDTANSDILMYQSHVRELDTNLKRLTNEYNTLLLQKKRDIEELESEFNVQIENAFKEKKILSEKYEKINDRTSLLESKLQEYKTTIENLNVCIQELTLENQNLMDKFTKNDNNPTPDYTEQYISEINKLNSLINNKNHEISELGNKMQLLQTNYLSSIAALESKNTDSADKFEKLQLQLINSNKEKETLNENNIQLQILISQKDEQIKQLMENKKLYFEMNIPKTEGMTISSSIEAMDDEQKDLMSSLQSQIISDTNSSKTEIESVVKKSTENMLQMSQAGLDPEGLVEPAIIPKKTYLCYKEEDYDSKELDPFNSEEGWGIEVSEETDDVTPGLSHLNSQIQKLNDKNKTLKLELDNANSKLSKTLKKIKELKTCNDMLSKELKLSHQISQSSMLDMAIESELSSNLEILEKKVQDLNSDLNKEKKEKEVMKKQNEVFKNANDRLVEMKEKMENELEMWKFNFKQANDKILSMQWGGDSKTDNTSKSTINNEKLNTSELEKEMLKVEKENDELQATIDKVYILNKDLSIHNDQLKVELSNLKQQLQNRQMDCDNCVAINAENKDLIECRDQLNINITYLKEKLQQQLLNCDNCLTLRKELVELQNINTNLVQSNMTAEENLRLSETRYNDVLTENKQLKDTLDEKEKIYKKNEEELIEYRDKLIKKIQLHQDLENEANSNLSLLNVELENIKSKLHDAEEKEIATNSEIRFLKEELDDVKLKLLMTTKEPSKNQNCDMVLVEKYASMEEYCLNLQKQLDNANDKIRQLELDKNDLLDKVKNCENQICELNIKLQNLNVENDQLLSTVAELRSSVSSAMDQRGFEIAELWKQHLAQRESDFQKTEEDLRNQLSAFQAKYEQLFENVQSSSEEETKKIIMTEQISSLQKKIEDKEEHIVNLRDKYAEVINELDLLRSEMEDEKVLQENKLLLQQEEYEKLAKELNKQKEEQSNKYQNTIKELKTELEATKSVYNNLSQETEEVRKSYEDKLSDLTRQLQIKESELFQKTHEFTIALTQRNEEFESVRKQLLDYEKKIEELTYEKESELAILRLKMHERAESAQKYQKELENNKNNLSESLKEKIIEYTSLTKQVNDLNKVLEEYANRATETQAVLESQELEIVTLKDEIITLQDALRSANSKTERHVTFASDTKTVDDDENVQNTLNKELLDAVPRAELDLALYMLHQRDVRCEELTMELTQLLEERDTLQLRLSDSLRSYEELKLRYNSGSMDTSVSSSHEGLSELPSFNVEKERHFVDTHRAQTSRSSSISDPDGEKPKLQAKLSELRSVKHSRDVRLRQESEQRQLGMRLLQRDVANLPPEAVEQLAQAHHTLSRDTQSTPTVLLNWLRGKSTPKVVHM